MNSGQRAAIAAIVIAVTTQQSVTSIYSYESSSYINVSGQANSKTIKVFDYGRSCYITGKASVPNKFSLFDYDVSAYCDLKIEGTKFKGYDYNSGSYFSGTVRSKSVSFYDFQTSSYYDFAG